MKDRVYGEELPFRVVTNESLWMVVPKGVAFKYVPEEEYRARMKKLIAEGKVSNPLLYGPDSALTRRFKLGKNLLGHYYKFAKYSDLGGK